ncbi:hypothetical protein VU11_04780 [Desulfobulbus sp. US2]|nr:hypothetical protein [Desulfobulbus sp. US2]
MSTNERYINLFTDYGFVRAASPIEHPKGMVLTAPGLRATLKKLDGDNSIYLLPPKLLPLQPILPH